jgi:hypothetical protein
VTAPEPQPGRPGLLDVIAAFFSADQGPEAEAALEAADEWDCEDSNAYQARVEAGLEPEAEL